MKAPKEEGGAIRFVRRADADFPEKLRQIEAAPDGIYVRGALPDPAKKSVAIIGARACSSYGRAEAIRFARELASAGVQIISGMAHGIDAWSHHGALEGGGETFAVLGTGVDICYPPSSRHVYERIPERGGLLSEFPPGTKAFPWHFPLRNRIISGLADLVLVVEARRKSGSLITADYALEQGKSVYAIPGRNEDKGSEGCNYLIWQGAGIAVSPAYLLEELGVRKKEKKEKENRGQTPLERQILEALFTGEKSVDALLSATGAGSQELSSALLSLCLRGEVSERVRGFFSCK